MTDRSVKAPEPAPLRGQDARRRCAARRRFWATTPGGLLAAALAADLLLGTAATYTGLAGLAPLPAGQILALLAYSMLACLVLNDAIKAALIRRLVPAAAQ